MTAVRTNYYARVIFVAAVFFTVLGLVILLSTSYANSKIRYDSRWAIIEKQLVFAVFGIGVMFAAYRLRFERLLALATPMLLAVLALLGLVFLFDPVNGVRRWIHVGGMTFQPSMLAPYVLVLFLGRSIARRGEAIRRFRVLFPLMGLVFLFSLLIMAEPDIGSAALCFLGAVLLLQICGARLLHILVTVLLIAALGAGLVFGLDYEKDRLDDWVNSLRDPLSGSYDVRQSVLAIGSGGLLGRGWGNGVQKLFPLPEPATDFVFGASAEEGGLPLAAIMIGYYLAFALAAFRLSLDRPDPAASIVIVGVGLVVSIAAAINIGVATGTLPVTGLPLPFVSSGGSALVSNLFGVGIMLSALRASGHVRVRRQTTAGGICLGY